jgi:predicted DNA-binding antitoxin AbrB/MazE fold protein
MTQIEAIYQSGVFKPLGNVDLAENQRVRLNIQPLMADQVTNWLEGLQRLQNEIIEKRGYFPDSSSDIAADRTR